MYRFFGSSKDNFTSAEWCFHARASPWRPDSGRSSRSLGSVATRGSAGRPTGARDGASCRPSRPIRIRSEMKIRVSRFEIFCGLCEPLITKHFLTWYVFSSCIGDIISKFWLTYIPFHVPELPFFWQSVLPSTASGPSPLASAYSIESPPLASPF